MRSGLWARRNQGFNLSFETIGQIFDFFLGHTLLEQVREMELWQRKRATQALDVMLIQAGALPMKSRRSQKRAQRRIRHRIARLKQGIKTNLRQTARETRRIQPIHNERAHAEAQFSKTFGELKCLGNG